MKHSFATINRLLTEGVESIIRQLLLSNPQRLAKRQEDNVRGLPDVDPGVDCPPVRLFHTNY